eukprot:CAMPEP_0181538762 /NCGR_PEP_ID=MMETSP1110-20121109/76033_1 /TAXON_ID=174948 /ORGANISM="Symbiodinium sp., Strain CCMP421" /LENGTH=129 /DNA_ID=CAMNT_0023670373 /DNA_START=113 /DNA_END=504 /DNA_ORIENTATION=-
MPETAAGSSMPSSGIPLACAASAWLTTCIQSSHSGFFCTSMPKVKAAMLDSLGGSTQRQLSAGELIVADRTPDRGTPEIFCPGAVAAPGKLAPGPWMLLAAFDSRTCVHQLQALTTFKVVVVQVPSAMH